jgi:hypothetical protein
MEVPDGWEVHEENGLIEIVPPIPVGAAHVTVLKRTRTGEIAEGEARLLAADFARKQGIPDPMPTETREGIQAVARTTFQTADEGGPYYWHVQTHVWNGRAVICSYTHSGQGEASKQAALAMFRSFHPVRA